MKITIEKVLQEMEEEKGTGYPILIPDSLNKVIEDYQAAYKEHFGKRAPNKATCLVIAATEGIQLLTKRAKELRSVNISKPKF